jgi:hypothetical protein
MINAILRKRDAKILRWVRKLHCFTGISLFAFFFFVGITSILLGWKKNTNGWLLAKTETGISTDAHKWKTMGEIIEIAQKKMKDTLVGQQISEIDRIDVRKDIGIIKISFKNHYCGLQIDATSGKVLKKEWRTSDFIEQLHDASILDVIFNTETNFFKIVYSTMMGLALMNFTLTGFWLWNGSKRLKKKRLFRKFD